MSIMSIPAILTRSPRRPRRATPYICHHIWDGHGLSRQDAAGQLLPHHAHEVQAYTFFGHANHALDGPSIAAAVADYHHAVHAKKRRATYFVPIQAPAQTIDGR